MHDWKKKVSECVISEECIQWERKMQRCTEKKEAVESIFLPQRRQSVARCTLNFSSSMCLPSCCHLQKTGQAIRSCPDGLVIPTGQAISLPLDCYMVFLWKLFINKAVADSKINMLLVLFQNRKMKECFALRRIGVSILQSFTST
jgi:hypothetical protein